MKLSRRTRFYSSSSSAAGGTTTATDTWEHVNFTTTTSSDRETTAAVKIQSAYRSHAIRKLTNKIKSVNHEADKLQRLIQLQETVDAVRSNNQERIKINEALMKLLFTLDSVPGFDQTVREFRRNVSRRIVGLQEILDSICEANEGNWDGFLRDWDDVIAGIEHDVCREIGGPVSNDFERFCAENLGFQCLQRFLRQ
ncbi:hypothetical protein L1987_58539 [Smallanthus sonchifolius]|uniref:Uncharacterized protein n=1 Tax=Smallanthus sonchifolius TaxID=185202 RepID=A0ACB9DFW4_9ASTR|nr:hypothetical protein L1987_58539 [Smallanthus sonchifolius]